MIQLSYSKIITILRMRRDGQELSENELVIADAFGSGDELDVAKPSLAFDIAAVIGREVRILFSICIFDPNISIDLLLNIYYKTYLGWREPLRP